MNVLILGGTYGLGREIAVESLRRGHATTVAGRSAGGPKDQSPPTARKIKFDLLDVTDPDSGRGNPARAFVDASADCDVLFWVSGTWLRKPFAKCRWQEIERTIEVHLTAPIEVLQQVMERRAASGRQIRLVTIASSSARKLRYDGQAVYGAVQAGKVQFARNLHAEADYISASTIVRPGGMRTDFFDGSDVDTSGFADPAEVARVVWEVVEGRRPPMVEMDVRQGDDGIRLDAFDGDGDPILVYGQDRNPVFGTPR